MQQYTARLIKTGFVATAMELPRDLKLIPQRWSANDRGGCKEASLLATGSAESLAYLCGWLGDRIEIYSLQQDLVWWGVLWDLEVSLGNISLDLSLDNVYNRVAVIYPQIQPDGSEVSATTSWAEDANSVARYGKRELLYGLPAALSISADTVRDILLTRYSTPGPSISNHEQAAHTATLTARGIWEKAGSVYFTNPDGLVEHDGTSGSMYIGRYLISNQIHFGVEDPDNPGIYEADEMHISGNTFDPLVEGDNFTISGASVPENNDTYTVAGRDSSTQVSVGGTFDYEPAGATVKVSWGDSISYDNLAVSFTPATSWICTHVALMLRQAGNPDDNFRVGIYPDVGGQLGTVLTAQERVGSTLFTELAWTEFAFDTPVQLTAGIKYWIGMRRTGAATLNHGYEIGLDEGLNYAGGEFKIYNGSAWVARDPDTDMPFRVIGEINSTEQMEKALAVVDDFVGIAIGVDSQIPVRQYVEDESPALQHIEEMLNAGTHDGQRLVAWVARDGTVMVQVADASGGDDLMLGSDGKLRYATGQKALYVPGQLVYGRHIHINGLTLLDGLGLTGVRGSAIYVQESEFDAQTGTITIRSEGAPDPWAILSTQKG